MLMLILLVIEVPSRGGEEKGEEEADDDKDEDEDEEKVHSRWWWMCSRVALLRNQGVRWGEKEGSGMLGDGWGGGLVGKRVNLPADRCSRFVVAVPHPSPSCFCPGLP
jgi:hypothetical protein